VRKRFWFTFLGKKMMILNKYLFSLYINSFNINNCNLNDAFGIFIPNRRERKGSTDRFRVENSWTKEAIDS
jgi:hypothetical protein